MARNRPSAKSRRSQRRRREKLQKASANDGKEQAETTFEALTPEAASATAQATIDAPASGEKGKPCAPKVRRCRHRHLPVCSNLFILSKCIHRTYMLLGSSLLPP